MQRHHQRDSALPVGRVEGNRYFVTMSCGKDEAMCVTDNLFSMEGKASFWSIISDTCPLAVFRLMLM